MKDVFVIGGNHHNILSVIRSLGEKGLSPFVIIESQEKKPYAAKSRYIKKCWIVKTEQEVLEILRREEKCHGDKPIVIACADNLSSMLDLNHDELSKHYILPGAKEQGHITKLMDKEVMSQLARDVGLLVPDSMATDTNMDDEINIPFPWIIKPIISKNGVKADIRRIYSHDDWTEYKQSHYARVQIQQLIEKDFEYQLIGLSIDEGKLVLIPGVSHVIRPQSNTNTGFLRYEPLNNSYAIPVEYTKKFLKETGYSGLFSMEFLRGKDGKDYFMEINFRNDGNAICVTASGVNLPYIWYLYYTGGNYLKEIEQSSVRTTYVMPEFADFDQVRHGDLSFRLWLKDVLRTDRFMEFDRKDLTPFFSYLFFRMLGFIARRIGLSK